MKAHEARELSNANIPKLADKYFKSAVEIINSRIVEAAKDGKFVASIPINLGPNQNIEQEVIKRLAFHYQDLGYEVKIPPHALITKMFLVSWQIEEPTSCN